MRQVVFVCTNQPRGEVAITLTSPIELYEHRFNFYSSIL